MIFSYTTLIILIQVITIIAIYIFRNSTSAFLKEKAKNFATKQDIGKITGEIESVKSEFNKDLAILNSNLSLKTQTNFSIQENKRILMIELIEAVNTWIYSIVNFSFSGYNILNIGEIKNHRKSLEKYKLEFNVLENKLNIFYENANFVDIKKELICTTLEMEYILDKAILTYENLIFNKQYHLDNKELKKSKDVQAEISELITKYYDDMLEKYKNLVHQNNSFTNLLKNEFVEDLS